MNAQTGLTRDWSKTILILVGLVMVAGAVTFWMLNGFSSRKLVIGLTGLIFLALGRLGHKAVSLYRDLALTLLNTLLLLIILEAAASVVVQFWQKQGERREQEADTYHKNQQWVAGYLRDIAHALEVSYVPYVVWKTKPYRGDAINVDKDGNRVTPGSDCEKQSYRVFMFGGSTMWGDGVPDWGTIPAYIQTELNRLRARPVCVRNFGQPGWVSSQSVIELLRHLQAGELPHLVIFYDGINDVGMASEEGVAGGHESISRIRSRLRQNDIARPFIQLIVWTNIFRLLEQFVPSLSVLRDWPNDFKKPTYKTDALGKAITLAYLTNYRTVKALAEEFGFDYAFFWQPNLFYEQKPLTYEEKRIIESLKPQQAPIPELVNGVYPKIQAATRDYKQLFFIADVFENVTETVYLNDAHLTHVGNQKMAKCMVDVLRNNRYLTDSLFPPS